MSDYISREYLLDVLLPHSWHGNDKNHVPYSDRKGYRQRDREVREVIINSPRADVRPNIHAYWEDRDGISDFMYCSNCGGKKHYSEKWIGCPYCLADMREPKGEKGTE